MPGTGAVVGKVWAGCLHQRQNAAGIGSPPGRDLDLAGRAIRPHGVSAAAVSEAGDIANSHLASAELVTFRASRRRVGRQRDDGP